LRVKFKTGDLLSGFFLALGNRIRSQLRNDDGGASSVASAARTLLRRVE
jgi:hypothetical protein